MTTAKVADQVLPPTIPTGAKREVAHYLGVVAAAEEELRDALLVVAERHGSNYEIARGATILGTWSAEHLTRLSTLSPQYGAAADESGGSPREALRAAPTGVAGELSDLCDLASKAQKAEMTWTIVVQGAKEVHDDRLLDVAMACRDHARRQLAWLRTAIEHAAPDAFIPLE
jgi:hypothetical protein